MVLSNCYHDSSNNITKSETLVSPASLSYNIISCLRRVSPLSPAKPFSVLHSNPYVVRALGLRNVCVAAELHILNRCLIQLEVEAGEQYRHRQIQLRPGKTMNASPHVSAASPSPSSTSTTVREGKKEGRLTEHPSTSSGLSQKVQKPHPFFVFLGERG